MASIDVTDLSISFPLYHGDARSLKQYAKQGLTDRFGHDERGRAAVEALRTVSFSLRPGDRLGLVGRNGAGKTTLLRALAGIYEPVKGRVQVRGRLGTLLDTSLGMNPLLTGRENIRLRCLFHGLSAAAGKEVERDVEEFSDLGPFMDLPINAWSSGMSVRLAFGLATAIMPQILIMDEWIMAGDGWFLRRAGERLGGMVDQSEIMVLSSHSPTILDRWCNRLIWMENGMIRMDGTVTDVLSAYLGVSWEKEKAAMEEKGSTD
ncbi:ABC transporter ATP-binding protein [Acetobacter sp. AN02]|uniref:ABC transporter ATP-binding protein n=1 Tax=Acetobacter sp. AN02 TaxID=2894186 RepID=UPI0024343EB2|nr:ABC transporter ATP-binding protein [Acetobacter sp. AN02]MDG6094627.1 ABC transporter ATP-binding protein [Acetobacter sp. AN02]